MISHNYTSCLFIHTHMNVSYGYLHNSYDVSLYHVMVHTMFIQKNFPAGKSHARKPNKAQTNQSNITGVQYFAGFGLTRTSTGVVSTFSYNLSSLYFNSSRCLPTSISLPPSPMEEYAANDRVRCPLSLVGHAK